ncbi:hypothetical protein BJY01DRAFT_244495 [Aspergillus pseudoustus]|uniref:Uncharacterized protein n=1 Tax=Aspergillus pseudoustus TaxID=1810923 RepID=A0ABR4KKG2_9EURO
MSSTKNDNSNIEDIPQSDSRFCFECLRNIDTDGKRYGFGDLKCKNSGSPIKAKAASTTTPDGTPTKGSAAKSAKKPAVRKGAKKSTAEPIPATKGAAKGQGKGKDSSSEETGEDDGNVTIERSLGVNRPSSVSIH